MNIFDIPLQALFGQLLVGLINGSFYAMLSLGLAIIFGLLNFVNFTHGVQYMMGAFGAWLLLRYAGIGYWPALILSPLAVGVLGIALERLLLRRVYKLDHLYGLVLTFGVTLVVESLFRERFGSAGLPYIIPEELTGLIDLGFVLLPVYRAWVILASLAICFGTWYVIEKTRLGAYLRAATENPALVSAFGVNVPRLIMLTYGGAVALAAFAGVMAAPIYQVSPLMGSNIIIVVFAVVVIGGMGSIMGSIVGGFALGLIEGLTKVIYPEASSLAIFVIMAIVLLVRPAGLFGRQLGIQASAFSATVTRPGMASLNKWLGVVLVALALVAPFLAYPVFVTTALCFALFASAFGFLVGRVGLLSFGHAAYFGAAAYVTAYTVKAWGFSPELGILAGTAAAAAVGVVFGALAIRRQGIYFAMVTLALAQMIYFIAVQAKFTGGEDGLQGVPRGMMFGVLDLNNPLVMYYVALGAFALGFGALYLTVHSPFGQTLKAISQNEARAISLGYRTQRYKLAAFVISATLAGLAGSMKVLTIRLASLADVHWSLSGEVLLMGLIGGLGTLTGPIIGAVVFAALENYFAATGPWVKLIEGVTFVVCVLVSRRGIMGGIENAFHYVRSRLGGAAKAPGPARGGAAERAVTR